MRKAGGAIAIALEPNNAPASMQSQHRATDLQHRATDLQHRVSHPMTDERDHRAQGSTLQTSAEKELQLIERAKQDPRAFAPLYNTYADMVWRFSMSRLRNPERASDVTSQTFVKAIQSLPRFQPKRQGDGTSFPAWLMMITRNTVIDEQRKHRPTADIEDPVYATDMATTSTPESIAITRDEQRRVRQAISKLSPKQQRMVELRIAGYSGKEIAEIMGMTLNGVRTAHSRAYSKLRDLLADDI